MAKETFLFLGASNDDCEWMAGGLARQLVKKGYDVTFACTFGSGGANSSRRELYGSLTEEAWGIIGVKEKIIMEPGIADLNQDELTRMISETIAGVRPHACFIQPNDDYMPHHMRFAQACFNALQEGGTAKDRFVVNEIYAMECPATNYSRVDFFVDIADEIDDACRALAIYDKWNEGFGSNMAHNKRGLAMMRGAHKPLFCGYAEGFKIVKADQQRITCLKDILGDKFFVYPYFRGYWPPVYNL